MISVSFCFFPPQLSKTNFSNNNDFRSFLQSLCATFKEFKMHEQIENEYIIGLLQQRCRTVYNVHSDNKLSEMLSLFEKGLHSVKVNMHGILHESLLSRHGAVLHLCMFLQTELILDILATQRSHTSEMLFFICMDKDNILYVF